MQRMDLRASEFQAYLRTLRNSHTRQIDVEVLNLSGEVLTHITPQITDGQITVDLKAEVTRTLTLSFLDPHHQLNFDSESPDDGALYADRMIRVRWVVFVPELNRRVRCTVFVGPIVKLDRNSDLVNVEAHGKERLALGALWRPLTIKKRTQKVDAIRTIMDRTGETRYAMPDLPNARMPVTRSLDRFSSPWTHARKIARGMTRQLYYDGRGVLVLRRFPTGPPQFTWNTGEEGEVVGDVAISNTMDDFKNVVHVLGGKPKGQKARVSATATAKWALSPNNLGRNGQPRYLVEKIEDASLTSKRECQDLADRTLEDRVMSTVEVTFDSIPIPMLDPGDKVRVQTDDFSATFRLARFTLPLGSDGTPVMNVGYTRKTYPNRRAIRR